MPPFHPFFLLPLYSLSALRQVRACWARHPTRYDAVLQETIIVDVQHRCIGVKVLLEPFPVLSSDLWRGFPTAKCLVNIFQSLVVKKIDERFLNLFGSQVRDLA